jgi:hypothetical protein
MSVILGFLKSEHAKHVLASELVSSGCVDAVLTLIIPKEDASCTALRLLLEVIKKFSWDNLLPATRHAIALSLVRYMEADGCHIGMAAELWSCVEILDELKGVNMELLVKNLARLMAKGSLGQVAAAKLTLKVLVFGDPGPEGLRTAAGAGLVPGSLHLLREGRLGCSTAKGSPHYEWKMYAQEWLIFLIALGERRFLMEAIGCGLLTEVHDASRQRTYESQAFGLFCIVNLTEHPEELVEMRRFGMWPGGFLELASCLSPELLLEYVSALCSFVWRGPGLAVELMAHDAVAGRGCLKRLKAYVRAHQPSPGNATELGINLFEAWVKENNLAIASFASRIRRRAEVRHPEAPLSSRCSCWIRVWCLYAEIFAYIHVGPRILISLASRFPLPFLPIFVLTRPFTLHVRSRS